MSIDAEPRPASSARKLLKPGLLALVNTALRCRGTKLPSYFHLRDRVSYLVHGLEPSVTRVAAGILRPGDTAVDIGANVGFLAREFASLVGRRGRVFAFEPDPATFECLAFNTRGFPQLQLSSLAISDRNESTTLYLHPTSGMSNSLVNAWENARALEVQTSTFDAWVAATRPGAIRLVKIDVEGAEAHVLRGMEETIKALPDLQIIMEFCPKNLGGEKTEDEIFALLRDCGHLVSIITPSGGLQPVEDPAAVHQALNENDYANLLCRRGTA
jgi:FkbM family methyltransferase